MYGHFDSSVTWADLGSARFCDFRPAHVPLLGPHVPLLGPQIPLLVPYVPPLGPYVPQQKRKFTERVPCVPQKGTSRAVLAPAVTPKPRKIHGFYCVLRIPAGVHHSASGSLQGP